MDVLDFGAAVLIYKWLILSCLAIYFFWPRTPIGKPMRLEPGKDVGSDES